MCNKQIFIEDLPRWRFGKGQPNGVINWQKCVEDRCIVKFIYDDIEGEIEIIGFDKKTETLSLKYLNNIYFLKRLHFIKCDIQKLLSKRTHDFKIEIGTIYKDEKRNLIINDRKYFLNPKDNITYKIYKYKCNNCGWDEGLIVESNLLKGVGCSCCASQTAVLGINTIWDTDRWACDLGISENDAKKYIKNSHKYINVKCTDCKKEKRIKISDLFKHKSIGCSCGDGRSYPEKFVSNMLNQLEIDFDIEFSPDWCKFKFNTQIRKGKYDFYFEKTNKYIIETDGGFHKKTNTINGQTKEESIFIDSEKDRLALENNIEVIRIDCCESNMEFIKDKIINSNLNNIFNLTKVDWLKCEEYALSNLVKKVCNIKYNNPEYSTTIISKIVGIHSATVSKYLKKGSKIWDWVNYDPKEEQSKSGIKAGKSRSKLVEMFNKEGVSLGIFSSGYEIDRNSLQLVGDKLLQSKISDVCLGKRKHYKGYKFKYV